MPSVFPAIRAGTIGELAAKLGLDPATLEATVRALQRARCGRARFDATRLDGCRTEGLDPPKTHWARADRHAALLGYPLRPGITFTYLGVRRGRAARGC